MQALAVQGYMPQFGPHSCAPVEPIVRAVCLQIMFSIVPQECKTCSPSASAGWKYFVNRLSSIQKT